MNDPLWDTSPKAIHSMIWILFVFKQTFFAFYKYEIICLTERETDVRFQKRKLLNQWIIRMDSHQSELHDMTWHDTRFNTKHRDEIPPNVSECVMKLGINASVTPNGFGRQWICDLECLLANTVVALLLASVAWKRLLSARINKLKLDRFK